MSLEETLARLGTDARRERHCRKCLKTMAADESLIRCQVILVEEIRQNGSPSRQQSLGSKTKSCCKDCAAKWFEQAVGIFDED